MTINRSSKKSGKNHLHAAGKSIDAIAHVLPGETHEMASKIQKMMLEYYGDVRRQAQQSFYAAIIAAIIGTGLFTYAIWKCMNNYASPAIISLVAGSLIQVISGINFFLYAKAAKQFSSFHTCLERTNRFLLANSLCENISHDNKKVETRIELIDIIANAPMINMKEVNDRLKNNKSFVSPDAFVINGVTKKAL